MIAWGHELVAQNKARRNWKALPSEFERDAVHFVFEKLKPHFCRVKQIRERIAASKAVTFEELEEAIAAKGKA